MKNIKMNNVSSPKEQIKKKVSSSLSNQLKTAHVCLLRLHVIQKSSLTWHYWASPLPANLPSLHDSPKVHSWQYWPYIKRIEIFINKIKKKTEATMISQQMYTAFHCIALVFTLTFSTTNNPTERILSLFLSQPLFQNKRWLFMKPERKQTPSEKAEET